MHTYFVEYETDSIRNSFLIINRTASLAWDETVQHIEAKHPEEGAIIRKFERVE